MEEIIGRWYPLLHDVFIVVVSVLAFLWGLERKNTALRMRSRDAMLERLERDINIRLKDIVTRIDTAGDKVSTLASTVQSLTGLPRRLDDLHRQLENELVVRRDHTAKVEAIAYENKQAIAVIRDRLERGHG